MSEPIRRDVVILARPDDLSEIARTLVGTIYRPYGFFRANDALAALVRLRPFAIIADLHASELPASEMMRLARQWSPSTLSVLISGEVALSALSTTIGPLLPDALLSKEQIVDALASTLDTLGQEDRQMRRFGEAQSIAAGMVRALALREIETLEHAFRVGRWARRLAEGLYVPRTELDDAELGGILHDVGLVCVPDAVLSKPGKLTPEEWLEVRKHPAYGAKLVEGSPLLAGAVDVVACHHERWDGSGYPNRLTADLIPRNARIFALVDAYDALTRKRVYRDVLGDEAARKEIAASAGTHFDPEVVEAFLGIPTTEWDVLAQKATEDARQASGR